MKNIKEKVITIFKHLSNNTFRRKIRKKKRGENYHTENRRNNFKSKRHKCLG